MNSSLDRFGFQIEEKVYSEEEVNEILLLTEKKGLAHRFGVRSFLTDHPEIAEKVFTKNLKEVVRAISPDCHKSVKSIYFDKPPNANWIVNWHQDLTINLTDKHDLEGFKNWRSNPERTTVQPPLEILESIFTLRIHLDDCTHENGALRVIKSSHKHGVIEIKEWLKGKEGTEEICEVKKGGILIMNPLTLHSSRRTENEKRRRVIHIEFTHKELPPSLTWKEKIEFEKVYCKKT